ncbi:DUF421 domain-containing protein [Phytohalomonas tamaricis]|uniref:DUF421 domain-containing protein n=1 Tax=Phytohalomonas tamaricis TaxID=2081032 RepID=UPI000D0B23B4|nr:YetF domain-containing protein [Phytohalomonas tamaricis]
MNKEDINLSDWHRILVGNAPWDFLIEILMRSVIMYLILLVGMRLLGKRMSANVSIFEMGVMLTLGAIMSVPMQTAERGMVPGVVILGCVIVFHRTLAWLTYKYRKVEAFTQGTPGLLVKNGIIDIDGLKRGKLSHEQLFAHLRGAKVRHLGQVKRVYLESSGSFSIYPQEQPKPGLSVLPARDKSLYHNEGRSRGYCACKNCGYVAVFKSTDRKACTHCGKDDWDQAVNDHEKKFKAAEINP